MTERSRPITRKSLRWSPVMLVLAAFLAAAFLLSPQARAWAQQILGFFTRTEQVSFPLSREQVMGANEAQQARPEGAAEPTASPPSEMVFFDAECASQEGPAMELCQMNLAQQAAGFPLRLLPPDDSRLFLSAMAWNQATGAVQAGYGYRGYPGTENSVWIFQGMGEFPTDSDWQKVPPKYLEPVSLGGAPAEYVQGTFVARPGAVEATWAEDIPMARLRWMDDEQWFEIFKAGQPEPVTFMDQAGMIDLAESLVPVAQGDGDG